MENMKKLASCLSPLESVIPCLHSTNRFPNMIFVVTDIILADSFEQLKYKLKTKGENMEN